MFPTQVKVNYTILKNNFQAISSHFPGITLSPVIKSEAYGHGIVETAKALLEAGATQFCVFRVNEAVKLRRNGIGAPIWVLLGALPYEMETALALKNVTLGIFSMEQAKELSRICVQNGSEINVHLAIDTGMGRLGMLPDEAIAAIPTIRALPGLHLKGIYSHVAKAALPTDELTLKQVAEFRRVMSTLPPECSENHLCASDAFLNQIIPELNYARPGICLYVESYLPGEPLPLTEDAMSVSTQIVSLKNLPKGYPISYGSLHHLSRDSRIAVLPIGYDDGLLRSLSNKMHVLIGGKRVPQLGRICMSMIMVDVTDIPDVKVGDEAVIAGKQGEEKITINELTELAGTTQHELLCAFGRQM